MATDRARLASLRRIAAVHTLRREMAEARLAELRARETGLRAARAALLETLEVSPPALGVFVELLAQRVETLSRREAALRPAIAQQQAVAQHAAWQAKASDGRAEVLAGAEARAEAAAALADLVDILGARHPR